MARFIHIAWFILCTFSFVQASEVSLQGTISSKEGTLGFATISFNDGQFGTLADEDGQFVYEGLESGNYKLSVSYVGYKTHVEYIQLKNGQQQTVFIELVLEDALDEVVISGNLKPSYISDSPVKIEVITEKKLKSFLPSAGAGVVESMSLVNGVQEVVVCGVCYTNSISINGLPGQYTALLMDGTPIYGSLASVYGLNGIPNSVIERFEVIKGPSSTLYGSEAVGGVINIITKNPDTRPIISVDVMGSTHLEANTDITIVPQIGNSSGIIGFNSAYKNFYDDHNEDGFGDDILLDRYALFTKWNFGRRSEKHFSIAAKYYFEDRRNGVESYVRERAYRDLRGDDRIYGESIYTHRTELFGSYELPIDQPIQLDFSYSSHWQDSYYGADHYKASQHVAYTNMHHNLVRGRHDLTSGITLRYQHYDDNTIATSTEDGSSNHADQQYIPGLFAQYEWTANDKLVLLSGIRLDYFNQHGLIPSPRLSLKYIPGSWTTFRLNFGTGFRVVSLFTEDHAFVTGQRKVEITESLQPERSYNLSLNLNHIFTGKHGSGSLDLEGYFTYFTNKIIPNYDTPGKIIYANVDGHAQTAGFSGSLSYTFTFPMNFSLAINGQRASEITLDEDDKRIQTDIEFAPYWSGVLTINGTWEKAGLEFAYMANVSGHMALPEVFDLNDDGELSDNPRPTTSKPFAIQNIKITKRFKKPLTLYCGVNNLGNFRQRESPLVGYNDPNSAPGFSEYFDTAYAYAPNHGIEFYLGVQWELHRK